MEVFDNGCDRALRGGLPAPRHVRARRAFKPLQDIAEGGKLHGLGFTTRWRPGEVGSTTGSSSARASAVASPPCGSPRRATRWRSSNAAGATRTRTSRSRPGAFGATTGCRGWACAGSSASRLFKDILIVSGSGSAEEALATRTRCIAPAPPSSPTRSGTASPRTGTRELRPHYDTAERMLGRRRPTRAGARRRAPARVRARRSGSTRPGRTRASASSSGPPAKRSPTPTSAARGRRGPAACAAVSA